MTYTPDFLTVFIHLKKIYCKSLLQNFKRSLNDILMPDRVLLIFQDQYILKQELKRRNVFNNNFFSKSIVDFTF